MFTNSTMKVQEWDIYKDGARLYQERAWGTPEHIEKMAKKLEKMYKGCKIVAR